MARSSSSCSLLRDQFRCCQRPGGHVFALPDSGAVPLRPGALLERELLRVTQTVPAAHRLPRDGVALGVVVLVVRVERDAPHSVDVGGEFAPHTACLRLAKPLESERPEMTPRSTVGGSDAKVARDLDGELGPGRPSLKCTCNDVGGLLGLMRVTFKV